MWTQVYFRSGFFRYGNAINQMSLTESGTAEDQTIWGDGGSSKAKLFQETMFFITIFTYTWPFWIWIIQQASPMHWRLAFWILRGQKVIEGRFGKRFWLNQVQK